MDFFEKIKNSSHLHHAYLVIGQPDQVIEILEEALKLRLGFDNLSACPDYSIEKSGAWGIKDSQLLRQSQARRAFGDNGRFYVLVVNSITPEAQNALLKTFEEPVGDSHFFIIARNEDIFLPTLRSRLEIIKADFPEDSPLGKSRGESSGKKGMEFLVMEPGERLDFVQKVFVKNKEAGKGEVLDFINELEKEIYSSVDFAKIDKDKIFALGEIQKARTYLTNPRCSIRLILEHLALVI